MRTSVLISLLVMSLAIAGNALAAVDKQNAQKGAGMPGSAGTSARTAVLIDQALTINTARTAILIMDYQNEIVSMLPEKVQAPLLDRAGAILKKARQAHLPIVYVVVRFRDNYPEIDQRNKLFSNLKASGRLREGTSGAEIHARVAPEPGDIVVTKRRVGAFSTTDLETILRAKNINTLVLLGISTSSVVLSTVRWAADSDYSIVVVSDACADPDAEVNSVLLDKVFPRQATVVTTRELINAIRGNEVK